MIQDTSRNSPIIDIFNSSYIKPDNILDHFKKLKLTEFYEKRIIDGKSSADAAKDIGISLSTIKRYKKDQGFKPERKSSHKTNEQKSQIYLKGVLTKMKNKEIRDETDKVKNDDNLTYEEKRQQIKEIGDKYGIGFNSPNIQDTPLTSSIKKNRNKTSTKGLASKKSDPSTSKTGLDSPSSLNIEGKGRLPSDKGLSSDDKKFMNSYEGLLQSVNPNPYHKPVDEVMKDLNDRL